LYTNYPVSLSPFCFHQKKIAQTKSLRVVAIPARIAHSFFIIIIFIIITIASSSQNSLSRSPRSACLPRFGSQAAHRKIPGEQFRP
jgi:hypothetical protein